MKTLKTIITASVSLGFASLLNAGLNETATLNASITTGGLEIVPASVTGPWDANGGASVAITGVQQDDALQFEVIGITVNDLDGNGQGWTLSATPAANLVFAGNNLPLGTQDGFNDPSDAPSTTGLNTNSITYGPGTGVVGYTVDYDVSYTVPALVPAGSYTGTVAFALVSL